MSLDLQAGHTISHFRLEKKLGEGGMGAVFLAEDLTLSRRVAIKFMSRTLLAQQANPEIRDQIEKRFVREAKSAAAINHPHICQIYEANFDSENWFIAMELIEGQSLADMLEKGHKFSASEAADIMRQAVLGLRHAWDKYQIIHRDIKPHNLMVTRDGVVKIVDMGLAKPMTANEAEVSDLTMAGTPLGTPQYMAPEQATGESTIDFKVDIFALGATFYELLTGAKAFQERTAPMIYMAQLQKKYRPIPEQAPETPANLVELVGRMLEPKAGQRIGTYSEILAVLGGGPAGLSISQAPTGLAAGVTRAGAGGGGGQSLLKGASPDFYPNDYLILGRYRVLKPIGKGRAGVVYLAMDTELGIECAVKSLMPGREFPIEVMPLVVRNYQALAGLTHPNLAPIRDLRLDDSTGEFFVVMGLLKGRNLREYTHRKTTELGVLELATILPVLSQVAKALDTVSSTFGGVHHDLKPESLFLTDNDQEVKILDFGVTSPTPIGQSLSQITQPPKGPLGSPEYQAPEVWQQQPASRSADQYALAVIIYEMLARRLPFWQRDPAELNDAKGRARNDKQLLERLRERVLHEAPAPVPTLSPAANAVLLKALAKDPTLRYPTCEAFIGALAQSLKGAARPKWLPLAIAAGVLILGAAGLWASGLLGGSQAPPPAPGPANPLAVTPRPATPDDPATPPTPPPVLKGTVETLHATLTTGLAELAAQPAAADLVADLRAQLSASQAAASQDDWAGALKLAQALQNRLSEAQAKVAQGVAAANDQAAREAKTRDEAARLRSSFKEQLAKLEPQPGAAPLLARELAPLQAAAELAAAGPDAAAALTAWRQALDKLQQVEGALRQTWRQEAEQAGLAALAAAEKVKPLEGLDPKLDELLKTRLGVALALGREAQQREEFSYAREQFAKVSELAAEAASIAETRFRISPERDFTLARLGVEMVWIKDLGMWVGKYEVTNGEYRQKQPTHDSKKSEAFSLNGDRQPAVWLSYYDAVAYCEWLNQRQSEQKLPAGWAFRLPTRDEWQALARAGQERLYPWGNTWPPKYGNFGNQEMFPTEWDLEGYADEFPVTCPVEKSGANEWGLFGLAGNAWEWVNEARDGKYGVYGGAWTEVKKPTLVIAPRGFNYADPSDKYDNIGFRLILAPIPVKAP